MIDQVVGHTNGEETSLQLIIGGDDGDPRVSVARFWSRNGDSQGCKRKESKESELDGREHG